MATNILSRKTGVIVGDDVKKVNRKLPAFFFSVFKNADHSLIQLFDYAQEKKFAIPAIVS